MPATALEPTHASADRGRPRVKFAVLGVLALVGTLVVPAGISGAATAVGLGTAGSFAVVGAGTVTNTGPSVVDGDLGVHPGDALTGFADSDGGPGIVTGAVHAGDATAAAAQADARTAYGALADQACDADLTGQDLGGLTLTPGVYCFATSAQLTGALTLDAVGDPDAAFIFRIGTALTTASDSRVQFLDDFASCGVFWQVGSAATLGTDTAFVGTVIAQTEAITANTGATVMGRLLALNAAVTLDSNVITATSCTTDDDPPVDEPPVDEPPVDEPPVEEPVDDTPIDDTQVDEPPVDDSTDGTTGELVGDGPEAPESSAGGPAAPGMTGGPDGPRTTLAATGSNMTLGGLAVVAIVVGCALVCLTRKPLPGAGSG